MSTTKNCYENYKTLVPQLVCYNGLTAISQIDIKLYEFTPIEYGVPQGSILGPLLFSIYVNDLPEAPRNCSTECYVDDTKLFVSFHSQDTQRIVEEMNEDLLGVRNWCFRNRLLLNPDKMKLIVFGSRQMTSKLHEFRLSLLGKDISPVQSAKDLGVILDSNLTFDDHIKTTVSECLAQISRVKHCLGRTSLLTMINALCCVYTSFLLR